MRASSSSPRLAQKVTRPTALWSRVRASAKVWLKHILQLGCTGQYDDIEAEIQYIRLRELRPKRTLEMSCRCGWSTFWLLSALHDNYHHAAHSSAAVPELWSYDIVPDVLSLPMPEYLKQFWKFIVGDARETLMKIGVDGKPPQFDYLFIDSDHSETFARDYTDYLFESQRVRSSLAPSMMCIHTEATVSGAHHLRVLLS